MIWVLERNLNKSKVDKGNRCMEKGKYINVYQEDFYFLGDNIACLKL